jgi:ABC-2 type transport system permease protein
MMPMTVRAMLNEAYKQVLHLWSYKYNTLAEMIQRSIGFLAIGLLLGHGQLETQQMAFVLPGWMMTFYARIILFQVNDTVSEEVRTGTLEQMYMSPVPSGMLLLGRVFAILVVATIMVSLSAAALSLLLGLHLALRWEALPVIALTLAGLFGLSFVLGGVALVYKSVHTIADLMQDLLLFVNGTFVAVSLLPGWLQALGLALPTTYGITVIRAVVLEGRSLSAIMMNGSLLLLVGHSTVYFVGGWVFYKWCERVARWQGTLGQY